MPPFISACSAVRIAQQIPILKVGGSNPFKRAKKEGTILITSYSPFSLLGILLAL